LHPISACVPLWSRQVHLAVPKRELVPRRGGSPTSARFRAHPQARPRSRVDAGGRQRRGARHHDRGGHGAGAAAVPGHVARQACAPPCSVGRAMAAVAVALCDQPLPRPPGAGPSSSTLLPAAFRQHLARVECGGFPLRRLHCWASRCWGGVKIAHAARGCMAWMPGEDRHRCFLDSSVALK
jgi:hypothetical protein